MCWQVIWAQSKRQVYAKASPSDSFFLVSSWQANAKSPKEGDSHHFLNVTHHPLPPLFNLSTIAAMNKVAIVTDSTAYLPKECIDQYHISVVPLSLVWGDQILLDGVDI